MTTNNAEKRKTVLIAVLIFVILISMFVYATVNEESNFSLFGGADGSEIIYVADDTLDRIVSRAIFDSNKNVNGETNGEGHLVLGTENDGEYLTVYALTQYGEYTFKNSNLVRTENANILPAVLKYRISGSETYNFLNIEYVQNGENYAESVKNLFPEKYISRVLNVSEDDAEILKDIEEIYADVYLESINRSGDIGEPDDFDYIYLSDIGIPDEVTSVIYANYPDYPTYIGTSEVLTDGVRTVYETRYNSGESTITLKTYEYSTENLAQIIKLDSTTGLEKTETDGQN